MNHRSLAIALSLVTSLSLTSPILALTSTAELKLTQAAGRIAQKEDRLASREGKLASRSAQLCENVFKRIDARINNYNVRKDNLIPIYQAALTRWQKLATSLSAKGYDTTKLTADLGTLKTMLDTATAQYKAFVDEFSALKTMDCVTAKTQFLTLLSSSKTKLAAFRQSAKDIHDFIKTTIKADLQALRKQAKPTPTPGPSVTPEPTEGE